MEYKFFKDYTRAKEFCKQVQGSLHYKGSFEWETQISYIEYPEGLEEFEYVVVWRE